MLLVQMVQSPLSKCKKYSSSFLTRILQFMAERLHIIFRKFPQIEGHSLQIWKIFCSFFSLVLYPNSSSDLVILGSQISLDSNHSPFIPPTIPLLKPHLPQKSKSVNKSDFPKSFLNSQNSNKFSRLLHSSLSLDFLLLGSIINISQQNTLNLPPKNIFNFYRYT